MHRQPGIALTQSTMLPRPMCAIQCLRFGKENSGAALFLTAGWTEMTVPLEGAMTVGASSQARDEIL